MGEGRVKAEQVVGHRVARVDSREAERSFGRGETALTLDPEDEQRPSLNRVRAPNLREIFRENLLSVACVLGQSTVACPSPAAGQRDVRDAVADVGLLPKGQVDRESGNRVPSIVQVSKSGLVVGLSPTDLVNGGWADIGRKAQKVVESRGLDLLTFRRRGVAAPIQRGWRVRRRFIRDASEKLESRAEVLINAVSVVLHVEFIDPVVDVVEEAATGVVGKWPKAVHDRHRVRVEASGIEVSRIGDAVDPWVKFLHERRPGRIQLQAAAGQKCGAVGKVAVPHGLRNHRPAQNQADVPPPSLDAGKEERLGLIRVVFPGNVDRPADAPPEDILMKLFCVRVEEIPGIKFVVPQVVVEGAPKFAGARLRRQRNLGAASDAVLCAVVVFQHAELCDRVDRLGHIEVNLVARVHVIGAIGGIHVHLTSFAVDGNGRLPGQPAAVQRAAPHGPSRDRRAVHPRDQQRKAAEVPAVQLEFLDFRSRDRAA